MSSALATLAPAAVASPSISGCGTAVQTPTGCVSAFFALERFDRRRGFATYALRVVNRTNSVLICRTWVVARSGDAMLAHPILVQIAPLSTSATQVPLWPADLGCFDRAIAEIAGDGVHCIVEAPAPVSAIPRRAWRVLGAAVLATIALGICSVLALRAAIPKIEAFAVAPQTLGGTTIRAQYAASGIGDISYAVFAADGREIEAGLGANATGSIALQIPPTNENSAYTLQLTMAGPLGAVTQTRLINALATHAPGSAQVDAIAVKPAVAKPGETVSVAYSAQGDGGYVRLLGTDGTIWDQRPFARNGQTRFIVPPLQTLGEMRVLLHVTKGKTVAQTMAGLAIVHNDGAGLHSARAANGTFEVFDTTAKGGGLFAVRIISPRNGMRIALTDSQSREVTAVDVGAQSTNVTLRAPVVTIPTRYTVVANFTDGFGEESVVQPVTVFP